MSYASSKEPYSNHGDAKMKSFFDLFFGPDHHTPIRELMNVHITLNGDGYPRIEATDGEVVSFSEQGSIKKVRVSRDRFFACGCAVETSQIGGVCRNGGCRKISCRICQSRCSVLSCSRPICRECSVFLEDVRLCPRCYEPLRRRLARQKVTQALLRPFTG